MKKYILLLAITVASLTATAKNALVVIAHGSPMPEWRKPILDLEQQLQQSMKDVRNIAYVRIALMEFTEPTIASVIADCEAQGIDSVFAIPLFIAPSGHSENDIPNILGHQFIPSVAADLKEEGTTFVKSRIPVTLGPTLALDDFLEKTMAARVSELSRQPEDEAVLVISHGDRDFRTVWQKKMDSICSHIKQQTGIGLVDYKFVAMGYYFEEEMMPILKEWAKTKRRIIVQGVYLISSASEMADMSDIVAAQQKQLPAGTEVIYSKKGILPYAAEDVCQWIKSRTQEWLCR